MQVSMVFFLVPQQPPDAKEIEGGVRRLARSKDGKTYEMEETSGGLRVTRGGHASLYPWHTIQRVRYEAVDAKTPAVLGKK